MTLKVLTRTAGQVMSSPPVVVSKNATLIEAAKIMVDNNIGCVPVVDEAGKFAGMITERTFQVELAGVKPGSALPPDQRVFEQLFVDGADGLNPLLERFLESKNTHVDEVMLRDEPPVSRNMPLWELAEILLKRHLSHIAVVEDGRPVGVVARHDLMRAYVGITLEDER